MSFRKGNQKTRRRAEKAQAGIPHPLHTVPPLPSGSSLYIACCISRPGCHNCSIHCKSEIIGIYSHTVYLYTLDRHGFPIELWKKTTHWENLHTKYELEWRRPDYRPVSQYNLASRYPSPPTGGKISYEPHPGVGIAKKEETRRVCDV